MAQGRRFTFTVNNPSLVTNWPSIFNQPIFKRSIFGYEKGASGTPHLQGYCEFVGNKRLTAVNKIFTAHWETAKGTAWQNKEYCSKDGQFQIFGDWQGISQPKKRKSPGYTSQEILKGLLSDDAESFKNTSSYMHKKKAYDERIQEIANLDTIHELYEEYKTAQLKKWQNEILQQLFQQDSRKVLWVVDEEGNSGKSYLARILSFVYGYDLFDGVSSANHITYLISTRPRGFVFDVTRSDARHFSYQTLEQVKNGFIMSGKYAGIKRIFKPVPVIIFSNFAPDTSTSTLSQDRWNIHHLRNVSIQEERYPLPPSSYTPPKKGSLCSETQDDSPPSRNQPPSEVPPDV